jgi:hypothetical protein
MHQGICMRKIVTLLLLVSLIASSIATFAPVKAESKTITVPDDYPTIQAAVGNASDGDTVYVKKGIYGGIYGEQISDSWLTINTSISLVGEDNQQTILHPPRPTVGRGRIIVVTADSVTISGIHIQGTDYPNGIEITSGANQPPPKHIKVLDCFIEGCYLAITTDGSDITIDGNYLTQNVHGIDNRHLYTPMSETQGWNIAVSNNLIFKNFGVGIYTGVNVNIYGNLISQNTEGGLALGSGNIYDNNITGNQGYGILFSGSGADVSGNEFSSNGIALKQDSVAGGGEDNYVYGNNFLANQVDFSGSEASAINVYGINVELQPVDVFLDKGNQGNYWSGYGGNGSYLVGDASHGLYDYHPLSQPVNIDPLSINPLPTPTATPPAIPSSAPIVEAALIALIIITVTGLLVYFKKRKH